MLKKISFLFSVLILSLTVGYVVFAQWIEPTGAPPGGMPSSAIPLNTSANDQAKPANLYFNAFYDENDKANGYRYFVDPDAPISAILSGRVGVGIIIPSQKLDVDGNINISDGSWVGATYTSQSYLPDDGSYNSYLRSSGHLYLSIDADDNQSDRKLIIGKDASDNTLTALMTVLENGNVGIGTTPAATTKLDIFGAATGANTIVNITNTAWDPYLGFFQGLAPNMGANQLVAMTFGKQASNNNRAYMGYYHAGDGSSLNRITFGFFGPGAENLMSIRAGGNVGIGETTPAEKLEVNGGVKLGAALNSNAGTIQWDSGDNDFEGYDGTSWKSLTGVGSGFVDGTGNANYLAKWLDSNTLTDSIMRETATDLYIEGDLTIAGDGTYANISTPGVNNLEALMMKTNDDVGIYLDQDGGSNGGFVIFDNNDRDGIGGVDELFSVGEIENAAPGPYGIIRVFGITHMAFNDDDADGNGDTESFIEIISGPGDPDALMVSTTDQPADNGDIFIVKNDGSVGIGDSAPSTKLEVDGIIKTTPRASAVCNADSEGGIYYDSGDNHFYGCNGAAWVQLD